METYSNRPPSHVSGQQEIDHQRNNGTSMYERTPDLPPRPAPAYITGGVPAGYHEGGVRVELKDAVLVSEMPIPPAPAGRPYFQERVPTAREDEAILCEAMSFAREAPPPPYTTDMPLERPVAIPHLTQSKTFTYMTPPGSSANSYVRTYSPVLSRYGIAEAEFLAFLDGLNFVSTHSQKLQALSLATMVMGFDPSGAMQLGGTALGIGIQAAQQKIFDRRAAAFLHRSNVDFFHPRRLHVQRCTLDQLREIARIPNHAPLTAPIDTTAINANIAESRVRAFQPWLAPLKFDVPPPAPSQGGNPLQRINNFQTRQLDKQLERDTVSNRLKELSLQPNTLRPEEVKRIADDARSSGSRTLTRRANRFEKKMLKSASDSYRGDSDNGRSDRSPGKEGESKELKAARRSYWLVITSWSDS